MTATVLLSELLARRVVALDDASDIGHVETVILDRGATRVERIQVSGRSRSPNLVDWAQINNVGADAVIITNAAAVHESRDAEDDNIYVRGEIAILGAEVLTTGGFPAGQLEDLHIDTATGEITAAVTTNGTVAADNIIALGTFALVIN